jgi:hypothetical protein
VYALVAEFSTPPQTHLQPWLQNCIYQLVCHCRVIGIGLAQDVLDRPGRCHTAKKGTAQRRLPAVAHTIATQHLKSQAGCSRSPCCSNSCSRRLRLQSPTVSRCSSTRKSINQSHVFLAKGATIEGGLLTHSQTTSGGYPTSRPGGSTRSRHTISQIVGKDVQQLLFKKPSGVSLWPAAAYIVATCRPGTHALQTTQSLSRICRCQSN